MGQRPRSKPKYLAAKLLGIRQAFGLTQSELIARLDLNLSNARISEYESGTREPTLLTLLRYARVAGVCACVLIDDDLSLSSDVSHGSKEKTANKTT